MSYRVRIMILASLLALTSGCGKRQEMRSIEAEETAAGIWQTSWVDPQIVLGDSLFTLIRAERIDSFVVAKLDPHTISTRSVEFHVAQSGCPVSVNLLDRRGQLVRPVLLKSLRAGYYKLSLDFSRIPPEAIRAGHYQLKADVCGEVRTADVQRD